jgi:protease IV
MENAPETPNLPPPPLLPPPPVITPPPPAKPRRSWGWIIITIVLTGLLGLAVLVIAGQSVSRSLSFNRSFKSVAAREVGPKLDECLLEDNGSRNKIAIINVEGIISGHSDDGAGNNIVDVIKAQLNRAADDDRVKAVVLKVDSPGGEVMASDQIYKAIETFQLDEKDSRGKAVTKGKPVICSMGSLAASGGYYISAPCRWIVADELTLTGSIGVIMHGLNYRGLMDKVGVLPMTYKSGKYKDMLSPDRATNDIPAGERVMVQALIDETYGKFRDVVADGRSNAHELNKKEGKELATNWVDFADGRVLSGTQAFDLGLVDELGDFDTAVDRAMAIANLKSANLVEYRERYDFANFLSMFGQNSQAKTVKIDLGVEAPHLRPGCMYFLWQVPE